MKTYHKQKVIELGRERIRKIRIILIPLTIVSALISMVLYILYFLDNQSNKNLATSGMVFLILTIGFVIGLLVTTDSLKEGTVQIKHTIKQEYKNDHRNEDTPQYKAEELYALLKEKDEVQYFDSRDFEKTPTKKKHKKIRVRKDSPNYDHYTEVMEEFYGDD